MRHRADQRLPQQLGLGAHPGVIERARDVETFERGSGIGQDLVDALAHFLDCVGRNAAEVDGDDAEVGGLLRDAAHQPDVACGVIDSGRQSMAGLNLGNRRMHARRQRIVLGVFAALAPGPRSEQHHVALNEIGKMLLDRAIDIGGG